MRSTIVDKTLEDIKRLLEEAEIKKKIEQQKILLRIRDEIQKQYSSNQEEIEDGTK
jgi:hypothetical protein